MGRIRLFASWPPIPAHLQIIHVIGFPLRKHLAHPWAARGTNELRLWDQTMVVASCSATS